MAASNEKNISEYNLGSDTEATGGARGGGAPPPQNLDLGYQQDTTGGDFQEEDDYMDNLQKLMDTGMKVTESRVLKAVDDRFGKFQDAMMKTLKATVTEAISGGDQFKNTIPDHLSPNNLQVHQGQEEPRQNGNKKNQGAIPKPNQNKSDKGLPRDRYSEPTKKWQPRDSHGSNATNWRTQNRAQKPGNSGNTGARGYNKPRWHKQSPAETSYNQDHFRSSDRQGQNIAEADQEDEEEPPVYHPRYARPVARNNDDVEPPQEVERQGPEKIIRGWGIKFSGERNGMPVADFLFRVETFRQRYQVTWQQILNNFHLLVEGKADDYYWEMIRNCQSNDVQMTWEGLRNSFTRRFQKNASELELMRELLELKQGREESFDSVYSRFSRIHHQLPTPMPEGAVVELLRNSLREETARLMCLTDIYGIDHLRNLVAKAETQLKTKKSQWGPASNRISEIVRDTMFITQPASAENNTGQDRYANWMCWNCDQKGHGYITCEKERRIFCYWCGKKDVTCARCPSCKKGNRRASGNRTGRPHLRVTGSATQDARGGIVPEE